MAKYHSRTSRYRTYLLIVSGVLAAIIAAVGVVIPGLPTTPLVLLASWCFYRSSPRLQKRLLRSFLGNYIRDYTQKGGITLRKRLTIILLMATLVTISIVFCISSTFIRYIVAFAGLLGCLIVAFVIPKAK